MAFAPPKKRPPVHPNAEAERLTPPPMQAGGATPRGPNSANGLALAAAPAQAEAALAPALSNGSLSASRKSWMSRQQDRPGSFGGFSSGHELVQAEDVFIVTVKTMKEDGAGTDSDVYITLHGMKGVSEEIQLVEYANTGDMQLSDNPFAAGTTAKFQTKLKHGDVGDIEKVAVRLDYRTGETPSWHLRKIQVVHSVREAVELSTRCGALRVLCGCFAGLGLPT